MDKILYVTDSADERLTSNGNCMFNLFVNDRYADLVVFGSKIFTNEKNVYCFKYKKKSAALLTKLFSIPHDKNFVDLICEKIEKLININKYSKIVFSYQPIEFILALKRIEKKYKNIEFIPFLFDNPFNAFMFSNNIIKRKILDYKNRKFFLNLVTRSKVVFCLKYYKKYFNSKKIIFTDIPTLDRRFFKTFNGKLNTISYFGSLSNNYRDPNDFIALLLSCSAFEKIEFFTDFPLPLKNASDKIIVKPTIKDKETYIKQVINSGILLNIGNKIPNCVPGKIFEYISSGKPIINLVYLKNDPTIEIINNYNNGVNLYYKDRSFNNTIERFLSNIIEIKSFEEIEKHFFEASPGYILSLIRKN